MIIITPELILGFICVCCAVGSINYTVTNIQYKREREEYEKDCEKINSEFDIRLRRKDPILYSVKETLDRAYNVGRMTEREYAAELDKYVLKYRNAQEVLKEIKEDRKVKKVLKNSRD